MLKEETVYWFVPCPGKSRSFPGHEFKVISCNNFFFNACINLSWVLLREITEDLLFSHLKKLFYLSQVGVCSVVQLCLTLCDPVDCRPPGSSVHGIFQARMLAQDFLLQGIFLTQGSNSCLLGLLSLRLILYYCATWEVPSFSLITIGK